MTLNCGLGDHQIPADLLLLGLQFLDAQSVREVGLLDLLPTALELIDPTAGQPDLAGTLLGSRLEEVDDRGAHDFSSFGSDAQPLHVPEHGVFDALDAYILLRATARVSLPTQAVEVGVADS